MPLEMKITLASTAPEGTRFYQTNANPPQDAGMIEFDLQNEMGMEFRAVPPFIESGLPTLNFRSRDAAETYLLAVAIEQQAITNPKKESSK